MSERTQHWDAFVSHTWEDKNTFVRPMVEALARLGISLWYDEISLKLGDSLSGSIDRGIAKSRNGIVVVSPAFLRKSWPEAELHALMTRRIEAKLKLLPIWHNVSKKEVAAFSPLLADLVALRTADLTSQEVALALMAEIRPDLYEAKGRPQLMKLATGEAFEELQMELAALRERVSDIICPTCGAPVVERILSSDYSDPNQIDVETFECGYVRGSYYPQACPHDPAFPEFSDYELLCKEVSPGQWFCRAVPKTLRAELHYLGAAEGSSEDEARTRLIENYNGAAPSRKHVHKLS
jgi:hypothetical protein